MQLLSHYSHAASCRVYHQHSNFQHISSVSSCCGVDVVTVVCTYTTVTAGLPVVLQLVDAVTPAVGGGDGASGVSNKYSLLSNSLLSKDSSSHAIYCNQMVADTSNDGVCPSVVACCSGVKIGCYANGFKITTTQWMTGADKGLLPEADPGIFACLFFICGIKSALLGL